MATATESDVRFYLPQSIEDIPDSSEITDALSKASSKVAGYDLDSGDVEDAEAIYAALILLEHKYRMPTKESGPSMDETFEESPAEILRKKFDRITNSRAFKIL